MQIENTTGPYQEVDVQALAIAIFKDEKADDGFLKDLDAITGGVIRSVIESEELKGKEAETVYLHLMNNNDIKARRLLLVGVGDRDEYTTTQASQMAGTAARALRGKNAKSIAIVPRLEGKAEDIGSVVVEGAIMGLFEPDKYRTSDKEERNIERLVVVIDGADETDLKRGVERGKSIGESVNFTRDLANEPGAYMTPTIMAERAREVAIIGVRRKRHHF
jgi:leucyl aminopeptidase